MHETEQSLQFEKTLNYRTLQNALNRLERTEKKLIKAPEIKRAYQLTFDKYVGKGYIRRINEETDQVRGK